VRYHFGVRHVGLTLAMLATLSAGCDSTYVIRGTIRGAPLEPQPVTISGVTVDERRTPIPNVQVELFSSGGGSARPNMSDAEGNYRLSFIYGPSVKGLYLEFRRPGYLVRRVDLSPRPRSGSGIDVRSCRDVEHTVCLGIIDVVLEPDRTVKEPAQSKGRTSGPRSAGPVRYRAG